MTSISIPIDEMLADLRTALEDFDLDRSVAMLDKVLEETDRICNYCENEIVE